jgi:hypothetical protein
VDSRIFSVSRKNLGNADTSQSSDYFANVTVSTVSQGQADIPNTSSTNSVTNAAKVSDFPYAVLFTFWREVWSLSLIGLFFIANRNRKARLQDKMKHAEGEGQPTRRSKLEEDNSRKSAMHAV